MDYLLKTRKNDLFQFFLQSYYNFILNEFSHNINALKLKLLLGVVSENISLFDLLNQLELGRISEISRIFKYFTLFHYFFFIFGNL